MSIFDPTRAYWFFVTYEDKAEVINATYADAEKWNDGLWSSRSCGCETREELIAHEGLQPACRECGNMFSTNWVEPIKARLIANQTCFNCDFWLGNVAARDQPGSVRVKGNHYHLHVDQPISNSRWRGFGGDNFEIHFHDGRIINTNDLWGQGSIPARWRDRLPDNATFEYPASIGCEQGSLS